jgi:hypothetical protein
MSTRKLDGGSVALIANRSLALCAHRLRPRLHLEETAARLKKKAHRRVSPSTIASWLEHYKQHCSYRRLRAAGLKRFPANQTISSIKLYHRQIYSYVFHRPKLDFIRQERSTTSGSVIHISRQLPISGRVFRRPARTSCSATMTIPKRVRRRRRQPGLTYRGSLSIRSKTPRRRRPH